MKNAFRQNFGGAALIILLLTIFAQTQVFAQEEIKDGAEQQQEMPEKYRSGRALEGSWSVQVTRRDCQTGAPLVTFAAMNSFMQGGTMNEFGVGVPPSQRTLSHGVWNYQAGRDFTSAFQFFLFAPDGTYAGIQRVRRQMQVSRFASTFTTTAVVEILNPAGTVVAVGCATETATRFE